VSEKLRCSGAARQTAADAASWRDETAFPRRPTIRAPKQRRNLGPFPIDTLAQSSRHHRPLNAVARLSYNTTGDPAWLPADGDVLTGVCAGLLDKAFRFTMPPIGRVLCGRAARSQSLTATRASNRCCRATFSITSATRSRSCRASTLKAANRRSVSHLSCFPAFLIVDSWKSGKTCSDRQRIGGGLARGISRTARIRSGIFTSGAPTPAREYRGGR